MTEDRTDLAELRALDREHVFYSWSAQRTLDPLFVTHADGCHFWDGQGNRWLDFASQFVHVNIGHSHPKVVEAIQRQAAKLSTVAPNFASEPKARAAELITQVAPAGLDKVFFTNGGTEANEHAVRMARLVTRRPKVLSAYRSYHGATATSMHLTGDPRRWPTDTGAAGVGHFFGPFLYRSPFHSTTVEQECERALAHLEQVITFEGPDTIAAVVLEPVVGTAGLIVPPPGYLPGVRALCDRFGIVFIADEVMSGFGRTGRWFGVDNWDVVPDLITFAKGVNSGYVPLGGVILSRRIADEFADRAYPGGLTYSGHPLACAAAVGALTAMREEGIVEHARWIGENVLGPGLAKLAASHPSVGDVRGLGVFWALELVKDRETREPLVPYGPAAPLTEPQQAFMAVCKRRGLSPFLAGNRVHVVPPCVISEELANEGLEILDEALGALEAKLS
jgi:taurine---2-oxoglutarate transaminase